MEVSKEKMIEVLSNAKSMREVIQYFGLSTNGSGGYRNIKNKILSLGLEIPKYEYRSSGPKKNKLLDESVFCENSNYSRHHLKKRIIQNNIIDYVCTSCGNNGMWNEKKLSLHLDHINGVNNDNRIDNLRFLCPNCHTQTETYGGKSKKKKYICKCGEKKYKTSDVCFRCSKLNQRKVERPNIDILREEVKNLGYKGTGRKYGVSDNAIRKWLK